LVDVRTFVESSNRLAITHTVVVKPSRRSDARRVRSTDGATRLSVKRLEATSERIDSSYADEKVSKSHCPIVFW
jgi:hypothetical protein